MAKPFVNRSKNEFSHGCVHRKFCTEDHVHVQIPHKYEFRVTPTHFIIFLPLQFFTEKQNGNEDLFANYIKQS